MELNERDPIYLQPELDWKARFRALRFLPRPLAYRVIESHITSVRKRFAAIEGGERYHPTIVVLGCENGPDIVDLRRRIRREAEIIGIDQSQLYIDVADAFVKQYGAWATFDCQRDDRIPLEPNIADVVFITESYNTNNLFETMSNIADVLKSGGVVVGIRHIKPGAAVLGKKRLLKSPMYKEIRVLSRASYEEALEQADLSLDTMLSYRFVPAISACSGLWFGLEMLTIGRVKAGSALYFHATKPLKEPLQFEAKQVSYSVT